MTRGWIRSISKPWTYSLLFLLFVKMLYNHHLCCRLTNFLGIQTTTTTCAFLEVRILPNNNNKPFISNRRCRKYCPTTIGRFFVHYKDHHNRFNRVCIETKLHLHQSSRRVQNLFQFETVGLFGYLAPNSKRSCVIRM